MTAPVPSFADSLREQFYSWEQCGRGWDIYEQPVRLEPLFEPFFGYVLNAESTVDDGRRPTLASRFVEWVANALANKSEIVADDKMPSSYTGDSIEPVEWMSFVELRVSCPHDLIVSKESAEQFLLSLGTLGRPTAFEIIGTRDAIHFQIVCDVVEAEYVEQQIAAHYPGAMVIRVPNWLENQWRKPGGKSLVVEFGLGREFVLPLANPRSLTIDPLVGIAGGFSNLRHDESGIVQILFEPVRHPWAESILRAVTFRDGTEVFYGGRDFLRQANQKIGHPLYAAVIRIAAHSPDEDRAWNIVRQVAASLRPLSDPAGNELIPLNNEGYDNVAHEEDLLLRRTRRQGMILNSEELVHIVHLPTTAVQSPKVRQRGRTTRSAPEIACGAGVSLGFNEHIGRCKEVRLTPESRSRHMHILGASGSGKSTLLLNLITQDISRGDGVAVLDPHGDLIDAILPHVPPERVEDVVLFDPADEEYPVGFNLFSAHSAIEKNLLASDLVAVFRRLSTSWGDQMNAILANAVLAFLESTRGGTILDLRRFLIESTFRKEFLKTVTDPEVVYYWTKEFPLLIGRSPASILTRLDAFLRPKPIRHMVGQRKRGLNLTDVMDGSKILLARLSHGAIGEENAHLLGTLLVSKIHQIALSRQSQKESDRKHFWLYVDEVQNFATPSMASILSGARKYRLGLVVAHQELRQIETAAPDVASALGNVYTRACFRLSDHDAKAVEAGYGGFNASDFQNLGTGEAICRIERPEYAFSLSTNLPGTINDDTAQALRAKIIEASRRKYATPRSELETELSAGRHVEPEVPAIDAVPQEPSAKTVEPMPASAPVASAPVQIPRSIKLVSMPKVEVPVPATMGRGGTQHKYLQHLIKRFAEGLGYRAEIEGKVAGDRAADVALRKGDISIACEICVTTDPRHEVGNVQKCLNEGFLHVLAISPGEKGLSKLSAAIMASINESSKARVHVLTADECLAFIRELEAGRLNREQTVRGYKVKAQYRAMDPVDGSGRLAAVTQVVAGALNRIKSRKK